MIDNKAFIVQIKGVPQGKHLYEFSIDDSFIKLFDNQYVLDASLIAKVEVEILGGRVKVSADISGNLVLECDRCLDRVDFPFEQESEAMVKFSSISDEIEDEGYIVADSESGDLDLSQFLYDEICINIPIQIFHSEGECNEEMINKLSSTDPTKAREENEVENNSPFGALKDLFEKKENNN